MTERVLTQFRVVLYYLTLIVYPSPSRLNLDYDFPISKGLLDPWTTLPSILIVGGVVGYGIWTAKKRPLLSYFVLWYFGNLMIESSVFPLEIVYEHRLYLPIVGSVVLFVVGVVRGWELLRKKLKAREGGEGKKWPLWTFFLCLTLLFSVCSYKRNLIWRDEITLWQDAAAKSPNKPRTLYNLALAFSRIGRYKEAIGLLTRAISLKPNYVEAYNNLGAALADSGRPDEAVPVLEKAISIKPDHPEAYFNLGNVYLAQQGTVNAARSFFTKAIMLKPDYVDAYINLAAGYNRLGRFDETVHLLERVEGMIARRADGRFNLGVAYAGLGNTNAARRELKMVRQVDPRMAQQLENFMRQVRDK
jgi:Flp pilus assembly protein TadD